MPSRERIELVHKSLESLGEGSYEVLIGVDKDDPQIKQYRNIKSKYVKLFEYDRFGYGKLWEYYNALAKESSGDWIFLWNDDAVLEKPGWIDVITNYNHQKPLVLNPYHPIDNLFPIISRKWYDTIGHFALNTHVDSWVQDIGVQTNTQIHILGVSIKHEGEKMNDTTHAKAREVMKDTSAEHRSPEMQTIREEEAKIIVKQLLKGGYRNADNNEV